MYAAQGANLARRSKKSKAKDRIQETEYGTQKQGHQGIRMQDIRASGGQGQVPRWRSGRLRAQARTTRTACSANIEHRMSNDEVKESAFSAFICGY